MLRPEMTPVDGTPSGGGKPKPKPKPQSHSNPYVAVPGDFLSPAPESRPKPPAAKPPANRPAYGPENPAPPNYGGPPPVYPDIISAPKPPSSSSSSGKKPDREKETPGKPRIAVASDFVQPETTPDISALGLEFGWWSEFGGRQAEVGSDDELVGAVAKSVQNEGLFEHYYDDLIAYLKNFASYGWDEESDRRAEAYLQKYREEMKLHYADQVKREEWLELADSPSVTAWKQHAAKSAIERVLVLDANTQAMLHDQPGVVGDDGHQTAGLQDYVVDVLRQFETIYIHNHPNGTGASAADLESAFAAGAGMLIVVTEGAYEEVYIRGTLGMELLRGGPASYDVGPLTTDEFVAQHARSERQALLEAVDPAEYVFEQEEEAPIASDYVAQPIISLPDGPKIDQSFARQKNGTFPNPIVSIFRGLIEDSAERAQSKGLANAGTMLLHWLGGSGEPIAIDVDEMIHELPGFQQHITNAIGVDLGKNPPSTKNSVDRLDESIPYQSERYTVYVYSLDWKQVGKGIDQNDDIYGFDSELQYEYGYGPNSITNLREGKAPEGVPKEQYDHYLAVNKFYYSLRVALVLDKETQDVEVALVVTVRDHYAWYQNDKTGTIDRIMTRLEHGGDGQNFPIYGQSSVITGRFNLKVKMTIHGTPYYHVREIDWAANE